jgi:ABC-type uncharacterized transport system substrate-binding protein
MAGRINNRAMIISIIVAALMLPAVIFAVNDIDKRKKVLVVMSYHPGYAWQEGIAEGIESVLKDAETRYFHMDTKRNLAGGKEKAEEAYAFYKEFKPDAVIAADDNAQSMFVVPYLKDKVETPVVFCGVNWDATKYGYPAGNVTGVVEKHHGREGLNFMQVLVPGIKKAAVIYNGTPSNRFNIDQIQAEMTEYPVEIIEFAEVNTMNELRTAISRLEKQVDALIIPALEGIRDENGKSMDGRYVNTQAAKMSNLPILGLSSWHIKSGLLGGVVKTGQEQGDLAARIVLDIFSGTSISDIPVTQNRNGQRVINMTTANRLGIKLKPEAIMGTEIVLSEPGEKVLVVMSYHQDDTWTQEIREGIESVLKDVQFKFFYMDTKRNLAGAKAKAKNAYELYKEFKPDAVIAADDNAQSMFVVPYLKDKVKTPVVFCGVNWDATKYGYPSSNITGVLEKIHYSESISFIQLIDPGIRRIVIIYNDTPTNRIDIAQLQQEKETYTAEIDEIIKVGSITETFRVIDELGTMADALIVLNPTGILDERGMPMEGFDATSAIAQRSNKPIIARNEWSVKAGMLSGVVVTGQEQGTIAARMVRDIFQGKSVQEIPVTENKNDRRVINVTAARRLGIKLTAEALHGTDLVR